MALPPNGFQDRLVMTASISLRVKLFDISDKTSRLRSVFCISRSARIILTKPSQHVNMFFVIFFIFLFAYPNQRFCIILEFSGTVPFTTLPAPITVPFPMFVPLSIVTLAPTQQSSPIITGELINSESPIFLKL